MKTQIESQTNCTISGKNTQKQTENVEQLKKYQLIGFLENKQKCNHFASYVTKSLSFNFVVLLQDFPSQKQFSFSSLYSFPSNFESISIYLLYFYIKNSVLVCGPYAADRNRIRY